MRRVLLAVSALLILLGVAVPGAALYYTVFTESGLQFLIRHIPQRIGNTRLDIGPVSGTIAHGFRAERVEIAHERVHVRIEGIQARVALLPLLWQTIRTRDAVIRDVYVEVRRRTKPVAHYTPFFLPRWLIVSADRLHIGTAVVVVPNGTRLAGSNLLASGLARHRRIRLYDASLQMGALHFAGIGVLRAREPMQLDVDGKLDWTPGGQPQWSAATSAHGDLDSLALTAHVIAPFNADFTGHALALTTRWHWLGQAAVHSFDLGQWGLHTPLGNLTAQLALQGNARGFSARGPVTPAGLQVGVFDAQFDGSYSDRVLTADHIDIRHRSSGAHATASGTIAIVPHGPRLDLKGTWRDFRWPLVGKDSPFRSASGEYTLAGVLPYDIHARGIAALHALPPVPISLAGVLGKDRFEFSQADVEAFDGHAELNGAVVWAPGRSWILNGRVTDMNPGQLRKDLPGAISFALASQGQGFSDHGDFGIEIRGLNGRLRGVEASGGGSVTRNGGTWRFNTVRIGLGGTHIALDGTVAAQADLRFAVHAQDLSLLSADSRGQLQAQGAIRGSLKSPTVRASARGTGLYHRGVSLGAFDAEVDFDPSGERESKVDAVLHTLVFRGRTLDAMHFSLQGNPSRFLARVDAKARGLALSAEGVGPYANGSWNGELQKLTVTGEQALHLELERPTGVRVAAGQVRSDRLCLTGTPVSVCAEAQWTPARWFATASANDLPISTLTSGLTPSVDYSGQVNGQMRLSGAADEPVQASVRLELTDAQLAHPVSSGKIETIQLGSGLFTLDADRSAISAQLALDAGQVGTIKGSVSAQRTPGPWADMPLRGELHANTGNLGLVTLYVPEIDRAAGTLKADVAFTGTVAAPLVNGTLKVERGEIDFYQVNLALRDVGFQARLSDNGLDFSGLTRMGHGTATVGGHLQWRDSLPYGKLNLQGQALRVVDIPEAQIDASPDLDFDIQGRRIEVTGAVKVPYAKIVPADLKGAVLSSSDEVLVGEERTDPAKRFQVMSSITLSLGDKVSLDTSGLSGRLGGNITVRSGYDEVTRATGELSIEEGKYIAYARKLDIQHGRLIFTGGPIQDPGVDLRAVKVFPDVTAGINVRGTLRQPRMSFFSDPSLPQSQIVSLILSGGGLESVQNPRSSTAGNEALAQGGALLAQQLGSRIGIEDVSLETDLTNETSLVLGKYLSPRLYVSYGVSLTEQLNTLKLRYTLGDHWTVKTEVGQARGADLVYTIDK